MTLWLERQEKMYRHCKYIAWQQSGMPPPPEWHPPPSLQLPRLKMTKHPSSRSVSLSDVTDIFGAINFHHAFSRYFVQLCSPTLLSSRRMEELTVNYFLPFQSVYPFHKIKFWHVNSDGFTGASKIQDSLHIKPPRKDKKGREVPAQFDTALIKVQGHGSDNTRVLGEFHLF